MPKELREVHALVTLWFDESRQEPMFLQALDAQETVDVRRWDKVGGRETGVVAYLRYRARGGTMNDVTRRLESAAKASGIQLHVVHGPEGFSFAVNQPF